MRIFVAGATGALGHRVVPLLVAKGHAVTALSRSDANDAALKAMQAEPRRADLFDGDAVAKAAEGCEVVLHLATAIPRAFKAKRAAWVLNDRIRLEGTKNLLAAAANASLYIQESVALVYGTRPGLVRESTPLAAKPHRYVRSAVEMERLVTASGRPAAILRCGRLYAADDPRTRETIDRVRRRLPYIGDGDSLTSYIHTDDAAAAFAAAVENGKPGTWNIADDRPVPTKEFLCWLATQLHVKDPWDLPTFVGWLLLGPTLYAAATLSLAADNTKAKEELGWRPTYPTFREGWKAVVKQMATPS